MGQEFLDMRQSIYSNAEKIDLQCDLLIALANHPDTTDNIGKLIITVAKQIASLSGKIAEEVSEYEEGEENPAIFTGNGKAEVSC